MTCVSESPTFSKSRFPSLEAPGWRVSPSLAFSSPVLPAQKQSLLWNCSSHLGGWDNHLAGQATHTLIFLASGQVISLKQAPCALLRAHTHVPGQHILQRSTAIFRSTQALVRITEPGNLRPQPPPLPSKSWIWALQQKEHSALRR